MQLSLESYVTLFFQYTPTRRRMIERISLGDNPCKKQIMAFAGCKYRAILDFFKHSDTALFLKVEKRFHPQSKEQMSNKLTLDEGMVQALNWMRTYGYLRCSVRKKKKILKHAKQESERRPKLPGGTTKTAPLLKDSCRDREKETKKEKAVCINPIFKKYSMIDQDAQIFASKHASDREILDALDACRYQCEVKRVRVPNPSAYFTGALKNKMKLHRGIEL